MTSFEPLERGGDAPDAADDFIEALTDDDPEELYESAPCAYVSTRPDGTIVKLNRTFVTWTGYDRRSLIGRRRLQDLLTIGDRIFYETHLAPALRMQGHLREIAVDLVTEPGTRLPVLINAVLKTDAAGQPLLVRTAIFDARERRAYEAELLAARRRAEESELRARTLAAILQASFLPPDSPTIPGLDVAGAYRPAGDGSEVGGDFFDVFDTGREVWGVVLGDVSGKGAPAAAVTSVARYTVRAEAARSNSPTDVLRAAHVALLRHDPDRFCTAVLVLVHRSDGQWSATIGSAGHPLPVKISADGAVRTVGTLGSILGMLDDHHSADDFIELQPGDRIVLYTVGVTEARREREFFGEDRVVEVVLRTANADARTTADALLDAAVDFQSGTTRDDIAIVVLRVPDR